MDNLNYETEDSEQQDRQDTPIRASARIRTSSSSSSMPTSSSASSSSARNLSSAEVLLAQQARAAALQSSQAMLFEAEAALSKSVSSSKTSSRQRKRKSTSSAAAATEPVAPAAKSKGGRNYLNNAASISKHLMSHYGVVFRDSKDVNLDALYDHTLTTILGRKTYVDSKLVTEVMEAVRAGLVAVSLSEQSKTGLQLINDIKEDKIEVAEMNATKVDYYARLSYQELQSLKEDVLKKLNVIDYYLAASDPLGRAYSNCLHHLNIIHNSSTKQLLKASGWIDGLDNDGLDNDGNEG